MPELPEVEIAARNLRRWATARRLTDARAVPAARRILRPGTSRALSALVGARVRDVRRVGKNLLLTLDGASATLGIWSHLGMTGKWLHREAGAPAPGSSRVTLALDDGSRLFYVDPRMFGRFRLVAGARFEDLPELNELGPDPLVDGIDAKALHRALKRSGAPVKVALLDQRLLAGIGNIQASEALHRAALDPRRVGHSLSAAEVARLSRAILESIHFTLATFAAEGADTDATDIGYVEEKESANPFLVYQRAGEPCPRCPARRHATITRMVQAQRATFFCERCQR
jgi:formamidopyrimidine-DNA glycosylase